MMSWIGLGDTNWSCQVSRHCHCYVVIMVALQLWFRFYDSSNELEREQIKHGWHKQQLQLSLHANPWKVVHGPLGATIQTFIDCGWCPTSPTEWLHPNGRVLAYLDHPAPHARGSITQSFIDTCVQRTWHAAQHHLLSSAQQRSQCACYVE